MSSYKYQELKVEPPSPEVTRVTAMNKEIAQETARHGGLSLEHRKAIESRWFPVPRF